MTERSIESTLESLLNTYQLRASVDDSFLYCGRWAEQESDMPRGVFHLIESGHCWVKAPSLDRPLRLQKDDLIVFPRGSRHTLCSHLEVDSDGSTDTRMLCGELVFQSGARNPVLSALPDCFVVSAAQGGHHFCQLAELLSRIAQGPQLGRQVMLDKLADSLFVIAICTYAQHAQDRRGLLAALTDSRLARALTAIHAEPGQPWTVETLARTAAMSRTAFALEFHAALGITPIQYLTEWRIAESRRLLRDQGFR